MYNVRIRGATRRTSGLWVVSLLRGASDPTPPNENSRLIRLPGASAAERATEAPSSMARDGLDAETIAMSRSDDQREQLRLQEELSTSHSAHDGGAAVHSH